MIGNMPSKMSESSHPLEKANAKPAIDIATDITIPPNFSPVAIWIAKHSFESFEGNSYGLMESNHATSYFKRAFKYATLNFMAVLSDRMMKKPKYR